MNKKKLKTYTVNVVRTGYGFCTFKVHAASFKEARQLAFYEAASHDYSEKDADYKVEDIDEE